MPNTERKEWPDSSNACVTKVTLALSPSWDWVSKATGDLVWTETLFTWWDGHLTAASFSGKASTSNEQKQLLSILTHHKVFLCQVCQTLTCSPAPNYLNICLVSSRDSLSSDRPQRLPNSTQCRRILRKPFRMFSFFICHFSFKTLEVNLWARPHSENTMFWS